MKDDLALRLAATAGDDLRLGQAKAVIDEYLRRLAECSVCGGSGRFKFGRRTDVDAVDRLSRPLDEATVPAGTDTRCPRCGDGSGDPEFLGWHCFHEQPKDRCQAARERKDASTGDHSGCGERVLVPLRREGTSHEA